MAINLLLRRLRKRRPRKTRRRGKGRRLVPANLLLKDLRSYLARNLGMLERGLSLFRDEEFSGIEFPVGGRFIDILAVDAGSNYVVIELKVSRGYDRVIGQLLRYVAWVKRNLAEEKRVRGFIVASELTDDLTLAASLVPDVSLFQYELALKLTSIPLSPNP